MPEYLKAYILIMLMAVPSFHLAKKLTADVVPSASFKEWKSSWFIITSFAFLGVNYWVFLVLTYIYVNIRIKKSDFPIALYMAVLTIIPPIGALIPGFGVLGYISEINYLMLLSIAALIPLLKKIKSSRESLKFGRVKTDFFIIAFITINVGISFFSTTITDTLRIFTVLIVTNFLPYYVVSRHVKSLESMKLSMIAYVVSCLALALVGAFEWSKGWLLYRSIQSALNQYWSYGGYLMRDGGLRASSSFGHSIMFGYGMAIALGFYMLLQQYIQRKFLRLTGLAVLCLGLIAAMARGPWVGAVVMLCVFLYLGKNGVSNLLKLTMVGLMAIAAISVTPVGDKVINLIPFIGKTDKGNIEYRQRLIDASISVVSRNPLFGNKNFADEPEMQDMYQGEHIIDIVNQYINVLLHSGYLGLVCFLGIFFSALTSTYSAMKKVKLRSKELYDVGRTIIATLISIMFMISSVADQLAIPYLYYICIGFCIAYAEIVRRWNLQSLDAPNTKRMTTDN